MKNTILIDLDTDREDSIRLTKPEDLAEKITNDESAKAMIMEDLTTICNALGTLIKMGNDSDYFDGETVAKMCINYLTENFIKDK